jgi:hypothetical protein
VTSQRRMEKLLWFDDVIHKQREFSRVWFMWFMFFPYFSVSLHFFQLSR